jgi:hypothetical protein
VVAVSGNAFAHVYLCDDTGKVGSGSVHGRPWEPKMEIKSPLFHGWRWKKRINYEGLKNFRIDDDGGTIPLIDELLDQESVGLLLVEEGAGKYHVFSSCGAEATIEEEFVGYDYPVVRYRYSVLTGDDPLGYADEPDTAALMADGEFHSGDKWLRASWAGPHPDAIVQFCQIFKSQRCGDIIVLAKPGWDLMDEEHIGSHGSIEREELVVPAILAGPGIANKRLDYARTVDIFPTCMRFFDLNPLSIPMDGRTLDIFD